MFGRKTKIKIKINDNLMESSISGEKHEVGQMKKENDILNIM